MKASALNLFSNTLISGAEFSPCRKYRYALWRIWHDKLPLIMFIGLNPSTANESEPDPTITRVIGFAKAWGYGGVYMMNLFALVSKNPKDLLGCPDPLGDNDGWIEKIAAKCETVVFAWGTFKEVKKRSGHVIQRFPDAICLKKTKAGFPWHPLYVKGDIIPIKFAAPTNDTLRHPDFEDDDRDEFTPCSECDGHPACEDFGCALRIGLPSPGMDSPYS